jgi:hypothetical protein
MRDRSVGSFFERSSSVAPLAGKRASPRPKPIPMHCHTDGYVQAFAPLLQHVPEGGPYRIACIARALPDMGHDVLVEAVGP